MKHDTLLDQSLLMLLAGELTLPQRIPLEMHLLFCTQCRSRLDALSAVSNKISSAIGGAKTFTPVSELLRLIRLKIMALALLLATAAIVGIVSDQCK